MDHVYINKLRKLYTNKTIQLIQMDDIQAPEPGTFGKCLKVDDAGQLIMRWDNNSTLSIIPGIDKFIVV